MLTPWLSGKRGWRAVTGSYAIGVGIFVVAWHLLASEYPKGHPKRLDLPPPTAKAKAKDQELRMEEPVAMSPSRNPPLAQQQKQQSGGKAAGATAAGGGASQEISIWRLLAAAPTMANILNHMQHDMHEFQVLAAWAPTCKLTQIRSEGQI